MKSSQIINMTMEQFNRLNNAELQAALKTMQKAVGQQVRRIEKSGEYSPALKSLEKSGGRISAKAASRAEMQSELQRGIKFMQSKTRTVSGARQHHKQTLKDLDLPADTPREDISAAWDDYNRLKEEYPAELLQQIYGSKYKDAAHNIVRELAQGGDVNEIRGMLQAQYEQFAANEAEQLERITSGL